MKNCILSLGSNMGNCNEHLFKAVKKISNIKNTKIVKGSHIYITKPVGYLEQNDFYNGILWIETDLVPLELLHELQKIENELERVRNIKWGPRTIDIDIIIYEDYELKIQELTIPHPRMLERAFVMIPLIEIQYKSIYNMYKGKYKNEDVIITEMLLF